MHRYMVTGMVTVPLVVMLFWFLKFLSMFSAADEALGRMTDAFQTSEAFNEALADMTEEEKYHIGHQMNDFIVECEFKGRKCNK